MMKKTHQFFNKIKIIILYKVNKKKKSLELEFFMKVMIAKIRQNNKICLNNNNNFNNRK
jgi:hypothetical protein